MKSKKDKSKKLKKTKKKIKKILSFAFSIMGYEFFCYVHQIIASINSTLFSFFALIIFELLISFL